MIPKPTFVKALNDYVIFVDQGTVDLKNLAHKGVFCNWDEDNLFARVHIDDFGAIAWNEDIDICPDNVYLHLKGITFEEWQQQNHVNYATN